MSIDHTVNVLGFQRRRLIPAPLPDTSSMGKKVSTTGQWVDLPPISGPLKEPFEIKVYEIDDVERLQRRHQEEAPEVSKESVLMEHIVVVSLVSSDTLSELRSYECSLQILSLIL